MEAHVAPFHPRSAAVADLLRLGRLGDLRFAHASFSGPGHRRDGALLDLSTYCLASFLLAAGASPRAVAVSAPGALDGEEESCSGWLDFGAGFSATFACSHEAPERQSLEVLGTEAFVRLERPFLPGPEDTGFDVVHRDGSRQHVDAGAGDPYRGLVDHVAAVLRDSADLRHPPAASVQLLTLVDQLRQAAGAAPA